MNYDEITARVFSKLGKEKLLHEYHDTLYKLMGIVIDFIGADGHTLKLSQGRNFNQVCSLIRSTENGNRLCRECDRINAVKARNLKRPCVYLCHAGFTEILLPLFAADGQYIGSMTTGQFFQEGRPKVPEETICRLARKLNLDSETLISLYQNTRLLNQTQIEGLIEYLQIIGRHLTRTRDNLMFLETISTPARITAVQKYVEQNFQKQISIRKTAERFFLSPSHFCRFFHHETGMTFHSYLNSFRIAKAKEMLENTELTVSEITFLCGFGSISQFNRSFRTVTGMSPRKFRTENSSK